eukprot:tig00000057_g56.t1
MGAHQDKLLARVEEPPAAAGAFDVLPDALLGDVFKALGPQASWRLRGVCRRWRRVVEETEWASFELRIKAADVDVSPPAAAADAASGAGPEQSDESAYGALSALFERRRLRLSAGASVSLRPELSRLVPFDRISERSRDAAEQIHRRRVEAACSLLSAIARSASHSGSAQPREVSIEFFKSTEYLFCDHDSDVDEAVEAARCLVRQVGRGFVRDSLLEALRALRMRPPDGAASALESLSVGFGCSSATGREASANFIPWPAAAELRAAFAPFSQLRSLSLFFGDLDDGAVPEGAAAAAAACPLLQSIRVCARRDSESGVLAALAPLAHLERIALVSTSAVYSDLTGGLVALADGAAGKCLRSIAFVTKTGLDKCARLLLILGLDPIRIAAAGSPIDLKSSSIRLAPHRSGSPPQPGCPALPLHRS